MFPIEGVVDRLVISSSGPEYAEARDLRVFATDAVAHDFVSGIGVAVAACPTLKVRSTVWSQELRVPGIGGEESLTVVQTFATDGVVAPGANWWEVVRVGNAVLLTGTGGEWGPGSALDLARQEHARAVRPIVVGLCVFSAAGCPASGSAS
jgi:hypothetical protein